MQSIYLEPTRKLQRGADIRVSRVPSLLSSEKDLMVRKGTNAGAPKVKPRINEERGGSIQSVLAKPSIKKRNPIPSNERK